VLFRSVATRAVELQVLGFAGWPTSLDDHADGVRRALRRTHRYAPPWRWRHRTAAASLSVRCALQASWAVPMLPSCRRGAELGQVAVAPQSARRSTIRSALEAASTSELGDMRHVTSQVWVQVDDCGASSAL